jgi:glycosyltransferase involved in cell wall biosynthesis
MCDAADISVAMATYNGQAFLEPQLASLKRQTALPRELVICDDGSSDATMVILNRFAREAPFEVRIQSNSTRLGHARNFLKAASLCRGRFVAFCDQDDVWLEDKIKVMSARFGCDDAPSVVVHRAEVVDDGLRPRGTYFPDIRRDERIVAAQCVPMRRWVGFAMTFRRALISLVPLSIFDRLLAVDPRLGHDHWVCFLAGLDRGFQLEHRSLVLYRQHHANAYGAPERTGWLARRLEFPNEEACVRSADLSEAWANVISAARGEGALHASETAAAHWESLHRRFAARSRIRAAIYSEREALAARLRNVARLSTSGGYGSPAKGGFGRRAVVKDSTAAVAGSWVCSQGSGAGSALSRRR